ncbi:hypothetical protein PIB30_008171 [Stylosanthes scabra]|uniref:Uncharacterized protein n=1 Tax=Stylosanthes scabra TaxID=79078 RepID=A0ABU6Z3B2_9FABA|nr:hypothetical protein [Stylosanthes scabra]
MAPLRYPAPLATAQDYAQCATTAEDEEGVFLWELMEEWWCGAEEVLGGACAAKFVEDPYSSLVVVQSSSSYVTINGNEESCGSSFSDTGTSLMATLHYSPTHFTLTHPFFLPFT